MSVHTIPARPEGFFEPTGVVVQKGARVKIEYVSDTWSSNPHNGWCDGGGYGVIAGGTYFVPGAPEGALIAKFGGTRHTFEGTNNSGRFHVGNEAILEAPETGEVYLSVNDEPGNQNGAGFGDNQGSLKIRLTLL